MEAVGESLGEAIAAIQEPVLVAPVPAQASFNEQMSSLFGKWASQLESVQALQSEKEKESAARIAGVLADKIYVGDEHLSNYIGSSASIGNVADFLMARYQSGAHDITTMFALDTIGYTLGNIDQSMV